MIIDVIVIVIVLLIVLRGWTRGLVYQLLSFGVLLAAVLLARAFGSVLEPALEGVVASHKVATTVAFVVLFLLVMIVGGLCVRWLTSDLRARRGALSTADRVLGALLGAAKGGLLIYVTFIVLIMVHQFTGKVPIPYASSMTGRWVMQHNVLETDEFPRGRALVKLGWLLHTREQADLSDDPNFQAIVFHPKTIALLSSDAKVSQALAEGDWLTLMSMDAFWDLLDEPAIQEHLNAIEWRTEVLPETPQSPNDALRSSEPEPTPPPPHGQPRLEDSSGTRPAP